MSKEEEKNKGGRPSKIDRFVEVAEEVILDDINAIILTDEDLVFLINEKLEEDERITKRTFENWKAKAKGSEELDEMGERFFRLYKKALVEQSMNLFKEMRKDTQWQRYAWIIERKFDDWNIKHKSEVEGNLSFSLSDLFNKAQNE